jgi:hypothetical protein
MMIYSREDVKSNLQAKLYIDIEMTNMEKGGQSVGLVTDRVGRMTKTRIIQGLFKAKTQESRV